MIYYTGIMIEDDIDKPERGSSYKIVGRDPRIDLSNYTVIVHGRKVIDYEKLRHENPLLYEEILEAENKLDNSL